MAYKTLNSIVSVDESKTPIKFMIENSWTLSMPTNTAYFIDDKIENNIFEGGLDLSGSIKPLIIRGRRNSDGNYSFELALQRHVDFEGRFKTVNDIKYDHRAATGDEGCMEHVMIIDEPAFAVDVVVCGVPFFGTVLDVRVRNEKQTAYNLSAGFKIGTSRQEISDAKNVIMEIAKSIRNAKTIATPKSVPQRTGPNMINNNGDFIIEKTILLKYIGSNSKVEVPYGITKIADNAFHSVSFLREVALPNTLKRIGANAFSGCSSLQGIELPDSVEVVGNRAFENCSEIRAAKLSKKMKYISGYMFVDCHALTHVEIPDGIRGINDSAFSECMSLQNLYIPQSLMYLEQYAFKNCSKLTHVVLPESLISIGAYAFAFCQSLTYLFIPASVTEIKNSYFGDYTPFHESNNITIYCPMNSYAQNYAISHGINNINATTPDQSFINKTASFKKSQTKKSVDSALKNEMHDAINTKDVLCSNRLKNLETIRTQSQKSQQTDQFRSAIAGGGLFSVGLHSNGSVIACGDNQDGQCNVKGWHDIVSVAAGGMHTVGLMSNGVVIAVGCNDDHQCDVKNWTDIISIDAGREHTIGVKSDGRVLAVGKNSDKQCNVSSWRNVIAAAGAQYCTIGLKSDGTVLATGSNEFEECDVNKWRNVVAISACSTHTAGLKSNGTVEIAGFLGSYEEQKLVKNWSNIIAITSGDSFLVGLKSNHTVVAIGKNSDIPSKIRNWHDIVAISAGHFHILGLRSDGSVVSCTESGDAPDDFEYGQCNANGWTNIGF